MGQLVVRNIPESLKDRLKRRAKKHRRSMEAEAREILRMALTEKESAQEGLGTMIANRFRTIGIDFEIPEMRGFTVEPPNLDE